MENKETRRPLILVSNDDGFLARGVNILIDMLTPFADVVGVCPDGPRSGQSSAITVSGILRAHTVKKTDKMKMISVNGTPADCVKLAMNSLLDRHPDLVIAGINHGSNAAINVIYSGTMGAVFEGCANDIPAIGFSLTDHSPDADFEPCRPFVEKIVKAVLKNGMPSGVCLNVNIPNSAVPPTEMRVVRGCPGKWTDEYKKYIDPAGHEFYMLCGNFINEDPDAQDTDQWCLDHGIVSVVPVTLDRTAPLADTPEWLKSLGGKVQ